MQYSKPIPAYDPISAPKVNWRFRALPPPPRPIEACSQDDEFACGIAEVAPRVADRVNHNKRLVFHVVGDTGNDGSDATQSAVAREMQRQIQQRRDSQSDAEPAFFYHLGDVVYPLGASKFYEKRFYEPYKFYDAPIVSIPGNHDGYGPNNDDATSLEGWKDHFLGQVLDAQKYPWREPQELPYVFWELRTPIITILGLYSNIDGFLDRPDECDETSAEMVKPSASGEQDETNHCNGASSAMFA